jgi:hypothetical protein
MTYDWAMTGLDWDALRGWKRDLSPEMSTGLHIHTSRAGFNGPAHTYKWMKFIYRNQRAVEGIARRSGSSYATFLPQARAAILPMVQGKQIFTHVDEYGESYQHHVSEQRYVALNCQNAATIEARVFASTLEAQELQAALGLMDASRVYSESITAQGAIREKAWEFATFAKWVDKQDKYAPLSREIRKLSLV